MRFLCVGDIHIKLDNSHLIDILENQIIVHIKLHSIECVILLGDILHYHEKLHTQCLNRACELIEHIRQLCHIICLVGNHDYIQNAQFCTTNHWMNPLKKWENVTIVDYPIKKYDCIFTPYIPPGRFIEAIKLYCDNDWKNTTYIFAHQEFKGCKMGAIISEIGDQWEEDYPMVISGHIHDKQKPQKNIYYIGASLQHSFGETGYPILLLMDINTKYSKELQLELPRKKTIYTTLEEVKNLEFKSNNKHDTIKIVIKGDYDKFKTFQKSSHYEELEKKCKVVFKLEPSVPSDQLKSLHSINFQDLLHYNVLCTGNEKLYVVYENIVYGNEVNENDILIIN